MRPVSVDYQRGLSDYAANSSVNFSFDLTPPSEIRREIWDPRKHESNSWGKTPGSFKPSITC